MAESEEGSGRSNSLEIEARLVGLGAQLQCHTDMLRYLLFVLLLSICIYTRTHDLIGQDMFESLENRFSPEIENIDGNGRVRDRFDNVRSTAALWRFLELLIAERLQPDEGSTSYDGSYLVGQALLHQKRVKNGPCPSVYSSIFGTVGKSCPLTTSSSNQDRAPFGASGRFTWFPQHQAAINAWLPSASGVLKGGGYGQYLGQSATTNKALLADLKAGGWVDLSTRAVIVDFTVYNFNSNRLFVARMLFDLPSYGGVIPTAIYRIVDAFPYDSTGGFVIAIFEALFVVYFLYMYWQMWCRLKDERFKFVLSLWNALDFVNFAVLAVVVGARILHDVIAVRLAELSATELYVDWQDLASLEVSARQLNSLNIILSWIRMIKYLLTMSTGLRMIKHVFQGASRNLLSFVVFLGIILMGYVHAFFMAFHIDIPQFKSMSESFLTAYGSIFGPGKFNFEEVQHSNFFLGPLLGFAFFATVQLLLAHMFLAILHGAYHDHRLAVKDVNFARTVLAEVNRKAPMGLDHPRRNWLRRLGTGVSNIFSRSYRKPDI